MSIVFIQIGLVIFMLLGVMHGLYTLRDLRNPNYFAPKDRSLVDVLKTAGMGITDEQDNFWRAYMGFHLSHSLGIVIFSATFLYLTRIAPELIFLPITGILLVGTGVAYAVLSRLYWFSKPFIGSTIAVLLLVVGFGLHLLGSS